MKSGLQSAGGGARWEGRRWGARVAEGAGGVGGRKRARERELGKGEDIPLLCLFAFKTKRTHHQDQAVKTKRCMNAFDLHATGYKSVPRQHHILHTLTGTQYRLPYTMVPTNAALFILLFPRTNCGMCLYTVHPNGNTLRGLVKWLTRQLHIMAHVGGCDKGSASTKRASALPRKNMTGVNHHRIVFAIIPSTTFCFQSPSLRLRRLRRLRLGVLLLEYL